ncbi:transcription elongation factor SPT4, putative [Eimeria brunetti]|uniref:Transcription elongation factor SPT4, putative n=2 Tax=Eimeria TaxID=5800 RepID=U6LV74_9EIME|nr:transcription elongation factor SPT4, putative [Eimeria brunetti]
MDFESHSGDESQPAAAAAAAAANVKEEAAGVLPLGFIRKVRTKEGNEKEKLQLKLRACISCRLVMTEQQFYEESCPNCAWLQMDGDRILRGGLPQLRMASDGRRQDFTRRVAPTAHGCRWTETGFYEEGCPNCAWLQMDGDRTEGVPGCYAVKVLGDLPDSIKDDAHRFAFAE